MSEQQPSEEELRAALEEQMRRVKVEDVLVQTVVTLVNIAGRRLGLGGDGGENKDLGQARLAIDGSRALLPLLPGDAAGPVKDALAQLQLAYAREAPQGGEAPAQEPPPQSASDEADRARARSKLWTPPGT